MRLTNDMRGDISKRLILHRFGAEYDALIVERRNWAARLYQSLWKPREWEAICDLPDGWLPTMTGFRVSVAGVVSGFDFSGRIDGCRRDFFADPDSIHQRVPSGKQHRVLKVFDAGSRAAKECDAVIAKAADFAARVKEAGVQARAALNATSSVATLLKAWPEVRPFVPVVAAAPQLPAIPIAKLNTILALPVDEPKAKAA